MAYPYQQYPQMMPFTGNQQQIQQAPGIVSVRSEQEVIAYPVQYGTSVIFKNETAPYIYTKTMGFSQLEPPKYEKYRLVKEETEVSEPRVYAEKTEIDELRSKIESLEAMITKKKGVKENE